MKKIIVNVDGMHCAACSSTVERALNKIEGVDSCSVNLTGANALINFDEDKVSLDRIFDAISNSGFTPSLPEHTTKSEKREKAEKDEKHAKMRLAFSVIFALPLFYISMGHMLGAPVPKFIDPAFNPSAFAIAQMILSIFVMISGYDIFKNAFKALFHGNLNMDTLVSMGSLSSFVYSVYSMIMIIKGDNSHLHHLYFESAGMILTFILIGRYLESLSKKKTNSAVEGLMDLSPSTALLIVDGKEKEVSTDTLNIGDTVAVKSGMTVPVDGVVIKGNCSVDESMLTGESMPVDKMVGCSVSGGTINKNGYIEFTVSADVSQSAPARIAEYVSQAQSTKAPVANLANKIASVFVPVVIIIALAAAALWLISGEDISFAVKIFVCVLVIACPCSLGLATPTALTVSLGKSASDGILIKNGEALEMLSKIDTVVFDKTGTITLGKPEVSDFILFNGFDKNEALSLLGSAELKSEHPISSAILDYCNKNGFNKIDSDSFEVLSGLGLKCRINGKTVVCGNKRLLESESVIFDDNLTYDGKTVVYMSVDGVVACAVTLEDSLRDDCEIIINKLNSLGVDTAMLTGDNESTANAVAKKCGIKTVFANLMPDDKLSIIQKLRSEGKSVAMVGDGINDAPSLTAADVGIAIGSGTDIAIETADIVLMSEDIKGVLSAVETGRRTFKIIKQNLFWAFAYNVICIPVAAGLLHVFGGPLLSPMIAAAAMSLSSITVVTNSLRLRKNGRDT